MRSYHNLIVILLILSAIPVASALETRQRCLNDTHIETIMEWEECDATTCEINNITQQEFNCTYGCSNAMCIKKEYEFSSSMIITTIVLTIIAWIFAYIGFHVKSDKYGGIQFLFIGLALTFCFLSSFIIYRSLSFIAEATETDALSGIYLYIYFTGMMATLAFGLISLIIFLWNLIQSLGEK